MTNNKTHHTSKRRYLIVAPAWIGDMVMAQSAFIAIKLQWPDAVIDVLAPGWTLAVARRMPQVDHCIEAPFAHGRLDLMARRALGNRLRTHQYTHAIVFPGSLKAALVPWFARVPQRTGYRGEMRYGLLNDMRALDKTALTLCVERFVALAHPLNTATPPTITRPALVSDSGNATQACQKLGIDVSAGPVLALCPGAEFGPAKRWPVARFAELARLAVEDGYQVWLFGSKKDQPVTQAIVSDLRASGHPATDIAGLTSIIDAIDLLSLATRVVSNDSGLMHIACALNKPIAVLYGSSTADFTPPLSTQAHVISDTLACRPCFKRECPLKHLDCLTQIKADRVWGAFSTSS